MSTIKDCANTFYKEQRKLFKENIVDSVEEAEEYLEENSVQVFKDIKALKKYMDALGYDVAELTDREVEEELEVFKNPAGDYFFVEA